MGENLTKKQRQVLDFINDFSKTNGYAPSYREIGDELNLSSPATVHAHIKNLKNKKLLKINHNEARSIRIVPEKIEINWSEAVEIPLAGLITAGEPIEAVEEKEKFPIPKSYVDDPANSYILKVKGDSMVEEGILDGDYVIVERNPSPRNGDVVVALLDNAYATLKKFYRETARIRLQPANSSMRPIYCKDPLIQGVVKGLVRKFV